MKKMLIVLLLCACATVDAAPKGKSGSDGKKPVPSMSKRRIAEIASYLPMEPSAPCPGITNRKAWEKLAELESAADIIKKAEGILVQPIPECPDELYLEYSKTGNRRDYELPYNRRIHNAQTLAVAECLDNKRRFVPKL